MVPGDDNEAVSTRFRPNSREEWVFQHADTRDSASIPIKKIINRDNESFATVNLDTDEKDRAFHETTTYSRIPVVETWQ